MGAVLVHERISAHFDENTLYAGLTNYAHPLGCAATVAAIDAYESEGLIDRAAALAGPFAEALAELRSGREGEVPFVRSIGLLGALELDVSEAEWAGLRDALDRRHVLVHPRGVDHTVILSPPLCIEEADMRRGIAQVAESLDEVLSSR